MIWVDFVNKVQNELSTGNRFFDFNGPFEGEHLLTRSIALGLRKLFAEAYKINKDSPDLYHHVVYRKGDTDQDRKAWNSAQSHKWILSHGARYVPDILIRKSLDKSNDILPIEVKYIKKQASTQSIATAIGQSFVYSVRYSQCIIFVGVKRSIEWGKYKLRLSLEADEDFKLRRKLGRNGITLILREVGV